MERHAVVKVARLRKKLPLRPNFMGDGARGHVRPSQYLFFLSYLQNYYLCSKHMLKLSNFQVSETEFTDTKTETSCSFQDVRDDH